MRKLSRRRFLRNGIGVVGALAAGTTGASSAEAALSAPPPDGIGTPLADEQMQAMAPALSMLATSQDERLWLSPTDYVSGDTALQISYPATNRAWTVVTSTTAGNFWISLALRLPEGVRIDSITVGYQVLNPVSFISEVRLVEMDAPNQVSIIHRDLTALNSIAPTMYVSSVNKTPSAGKAVMLMLQLTYQFTRTSAAPQHAIRLGAVGITFTRPGTTSATLRSEASIAALRLSSGLQEEHVFVSGYASQNDGGGGFFYWDAQSTAADNGGTVIQATGVATGRWIRVITSNCLSVKYFGATGDGSTDDRAAIQATIDNALRSKIANVFMPDGRYLTNGPIHLGYGSGYVTVNLIGADSTYVGDASFPGVTIIADFSNAPAIVVQGGRDIKIKNITLRGVSHGYGSTWGPLINTQTVSYAEVSDPKKWVTNIAGSGLSRYAPYAAIAIDPYSGNRPAVSYPDVAYPDWTNLTTQYNKNFSSNTTIENVFIDGFFIGVANQPCDDDGNGDFTTIHSSTIINVAYGVSVGNSQSRNVGITDTQFQYVHTIVSTDIIGRQMGRIGGPILNCSASQIYQLFSFPNSITGPVTFDNFYVEEIIRLGVADIGGAQSNPVTLNACSFAYVGFTHGQVTGDIYNVPFYEGATPLTFNSTDVLFRSNFGLVTGRAGTILIRNSGIQGWGYNGTITSDEQKLAYNYLVGGAGVMTDQRSLEGSIDVSVFQNLADPKPSLLTNNITNVTSGRGQIHRYVKYIQYAGQAGPLIPIQGVNMASPIDFSSLINPAFSAATLTLTFTFLGDRQLYTNRFRIEPGCILWHEFSNAMFVVDTVVANGSNWDISAMMVTNYWINQSGSYIPIEPVNIAGYLYLYQTFHKGTSFQYRGDITFDSPIITNIRRSDGYGGDVPADFKVGDLVFNNDLFWDNHLPSGAKVVSTAAGTITLDRNATMTATGVAIELYR